MQDEPNKKPSIDGQVKQNAPAQEDPQIALAKIMLRREARLIAAEEEAQRAAEQKQRQRDANAQSHDEDLKHKQRTCKHLKGGKSRLRTQAKDYAVYMHTFINGKTHIKCFLCKMKWLPTDTREFLTRSNRQVPNHTKLGWDDAVQMQGESSNQPSSSEIPMNATPSVQSTEV